VSGSQKTEIYIFFPNPEILLPWFIALDKARAAPFEISVKASSISMSVHICLKQGTSCRIFQTLIMKPWAAALSSNNCKRPYFHTRIKISDLSKQCIAPVFLNSWFY